MSDKHSHEKLPESVDETSNKDKDEEIEEIEEKSFLNRLVDLIDSLKLVDDYKDHKGLSAFLSVIGTIERKEGEQRENLEDSVKSNFQEFYARHRKDFIDENLEFLNKETEVIIFGKSGKANIPISEIYSSMCKNNPELIDTVEGCIYFVLQHVCSDEDLDSILEICKEFEPEVYEPSGGFIEFVGNIVGRVSEKVGNSDVRSLENKDGKIDTQAIGSVVQDLISDDIIQGSMKSMMTNITSDDFDMNSVLSNLMSMSKGK